MIRHVVMWKFNPNNKDENISMLKEMLLGLKDHIPEIINISAGRDVGASEWDMALVMDVESLEALEAYKNHPKHKAAADFSKRVSSQVHSVDFELD
jgi:hypothetical protein